MLYILTRNGNVVKIVDSPTDLDRMPEDYLRRMCRDLRIQWQDSDGRQIRVLPIRPKDIKPWDVPAGMVRSGW